MKLLTEIIGALIVCGLITIGITWVINNVNFNKKGNKDV